VLATVVTVVWDSGNSDGSGDSGGNDGGNGTVTAVVTVVVLIVWRQLVTVMTVVSGDIGDSD
jgi:predicted metalloprotease